MSEPATAAEEDPAEAAANSQPGASAATLQETAAGQQAEQLGPPPPDEQFFATNEAVAASITESARTKSFQQRASQVAGTGTDAALEAASAVEDGPSTASTAASTAEAAPAATAASAVKPSPSRKLAPKPTISADPATGSDVVPNPADEQAGTAGSPTPAAAKTAAKPAVRKPAAAVAKPFAGSDAAGGTATAQAGAQPASASAAPAAAKPAVVKKKLSQVGAVTAAASAAAPVAVSSSHGSSTSRRLQALLAEGSTVSVLDSVLSAEGSELPGSRPPAQLHGALEAYRGAAEVIDESEEQEIQKIISEIHGTGDDSEDEVPACVSPSKRGSCIGNVAAVPAAAAMPSSLMVSQPTAADDLVVYEEQTQQSGTHDLNPATNSIQSSSMAAGGSGGLTARSGASLIGAASAHVSDTNAAVALNPLPDGSLSGLVPEGELMGGEDDDRSRAIAEQLAQLHEESRRLQLQSQVLQQRAIEMSMQMVAGGSNDPVQHHNQDSNYAAAPSHNHPQAQGLSSQAASGVQLSQYSNLQTLDHMLNTTDHDSEGVIPPGGCVPGHQGLLPTGAVHSTDALGLGSEVLPRHPPGDITPSSATSSRAGLNWKVPSRGGVVSPSNGSYAASPCPASPYLNSADPSRYGSPGGNQYQHTQHSYAMHAQPSLDYNMYSYSNSSTNSEAAAPTGLVGSYSSMPYIQQQYHQQQQHLQPQHYQQQQQQQHIPGSVDVSEPLSPAAALTSRSAAASKAEMLRQQKSNSGSGGKAWNSNAIPVVVRKPPLPVKATSGVTTRVAAAGATAGRRSSTDACAMDEEPLVGTFNTAHAVVGAAGAAVKAGNGRLSPRPGAGSPTAAASAASAAKQAAASSKSKAAAPVAAAAAATGNAANKGRSSTGPTAAALAAAAASAGSSGKLGRSSAAAAAAAALPWGPSAPYPAAMYGAYGAVNPAAMAAASNPAMITMMMMKQQQTSQNPSNKGIANKINPNSKTLGVGGPWMPGMPIGLPPVFMPVQGSISAPGSTGHKGLSNKGGFNGGTMQAPGAMYGSGTAGKVSGGNVQGGQRGTVRASSVSAPPLMMPFGMPVLPGVPPYINMPGQMPAMGFNPYALNPGGAKGQSKNSKGGAVLPGFVPAGAWGVPGMVPPGMYSAMQQQQQQQQQQGGGKGSIKAGKPGWTK